MRCIWHTLSDSSIFIRIDARDVAGQMLPGPIYPRRRREVCNYRSYMTYARDHTASWMTSRRSVPATSTDAAAAAAHQRTMT